jgi:hypothetical protein
MPPKKGAPKKSSGNPPRRVPHANETVAKGKQPGHGAVNRAKDAMWTTATEEPSSFMEPPGKKKK